MEKNERSFASEILEPAMNRLSAWDRLGLVSAACGGVLCAGLAGPPMAPLDRLFLVTPLVIVPLGLVLLSALTSPESGWARRMHRAAQLLQPLAALLVTASFCIDPGPAAGALIAPWVVLGALVAACGVLRAAKGRIVGVRRVLLTAAQVSLAGGAVWLVVARLGVSPVGRPPAIALPAAVHLHSSGFAGLLLIAATGRQLGSLGRALRMSYRLAGVGCLAGILCIASGNFLSPVLKFVGVCLVAASLMAFVIVADGVARRLPDGAARILLQLSVAAVVGGMVLAVINGLSELLGYSWISLSQMALSHGVLNGLGYLLCGLLAHILLSIEPSAPRVRVEDTAVAAR
jgi:hypothetical protein